MSGHSKWSQIKRAKGVTDAARGRLFTKLGKEILVAVKHGGPDPDGNARLRDAIAKAKQNNMPNDNIARMIKNAASGADKSNFESVVYEGYAAGGIAVMVDALTDNKNRTAAAVRSAFDKNGGSLGVSGSVSHILVRIENEVLSDYTIPVPAEKEAAFERLLETLEDLDDVQDVWHNAE